MTIPVEVRAGEARFEEQATRGRLVVPIDAARPLRFDARLLRPAVVRDALSVLARVFASDLRFKAQDRSDYLAFLLKQGKKATKELWEAQKAFLEDKYGDAATEEAPLDPLVTVDATGLTLEVLSADESAYARLTIKPEAYDADVVEPGTSHLRADDALSSALARLRGYRETQLSLGPDLVEEAEVRELDVPERWLRAFSQVQAASTLPAAGFTLAPVDFYNLLFTLRMHRAKTSPRALRYELVPGEPPRMVLEPWDHLIESAGGEYLGHAPQVVRTWGRRRLSVLAPLLPHLERVTVYPSGPGLPVFYELDLGDCLFSVALSGWTDRGWAGISSFDLLVPSEVDAGARQRALSALADGPATLSSLVDATGSSVDEVRGALLWEIQRGMVLHERGSGEFRARPLLASPLDADALRYRDAVEEEAHRLLAVDGQVRILKTHDLGDEGFRIEGEVEDKHARRTYQTSFTLDREGRTVAASCTSRQFRRSGLKEGPSAPMIALRLLYARQQKELDAARQTEAGRRLIRAETRTLLERRGAVSVVHRVTLDERQVRVRWGQAGQTPRMQRLMFGTVAEAQDDYFRRLDAYAERGYLDASAAERIA